MIRWKLDRPAGVALKVLCLGAHSDDIEIGCGGTILRILEEHPGCELHWIVFAAAGDRGDEARQGAQLFGGSRVVNGPLLKEFPDGFLPYVGADVKAVFETLKPIAPDIIFTHNSRDAHQDHRLLCELTWNTFRDHQIFEYEIPKYDGDMGRPNVFVPLAQPVYEKKVAHLMDTFATQRSKRWFQPETFLSLMRLRGMECNSASGYAEAFYCRKLVL